MGGWALPRLHPRPRAQAWGASRLLGALPTCPRSSGSQEFPSCDLCGPVTLAVWALSGRGASWGGRTRAECDGQEPGPLRKGR